LLTINTNAYAEEGYESASRESGVEGAPEQKHGKGLQDGGWQRTLPAGEEGAEVEVRLLSDWREIVFRSTTFNFFQTLFYATNKTIQHIRESFLVVF
jgi:hypothetical protein